jgi:hypothetical protein
LLDGWFIDSYLMTLSRVIYRLMLLLPQRQILTTIGDVVLQRATNEHSSKYVSHWALVISSHLHVLTQCRCRIVNLPHSKPSPGMLLYSKHSPSAYLLYSKPSPWILYYIENIPRGKNLLYIKHSPIHSRSSPRIFCYIVNGPP